MAILFYSFFLDFNALKVQIQSFKTMTVLLLLQIQESANLR